METIIPSQETIDKTNRIVHDIVDPVLKHRAHLMSEALALKTEISDLKNLLRIHNIDFSDITKKETGEYGYTGWVGWKQN